MLGILDDFFAELKAKSDFLFTRTFGGLFIPLKRNKAQPPHRISCLAPLSFHEETDPFRCGTSGNFIVDSICLILCSIFTHFDP
jgi:hypothetical protein